MLSSNNHNMIEMSTNRGINYERMDESDDEDIYNVRKDLKINKKVHKKMRPICMALIVIVFLAILLFITYCVVLITYESPANYTGHKVYKLLPLSTRDLNAIIGIERKYQIEYWNEPYFKDPSEPVLIQISSPEEEALLKEELNQLNINYTISIEDLQKAIEEENVEHHRHHNETGFDFSRYHTYDEIVDYLKSDVIESNLVGVDSIGKSFEGRKIPVIRISSDLKNESKPVILIDSLIHSKEWVTGATTLFIINQLITNQSMKYLIDKYEFNLIPIFNPDGYAYSWRTDRLWRKSRSFSFTSIMCRGVDLNRNFDINFGSQSTEEIISSCGEYYAGDYAYSEPEVIAFREYTYKLSQTKRLKAYFSLHSFKQQILYPSVEYSQQFTDNITQLYTLAQLAANAILQYSGFTYKFGSTSQLLKSTYGSSIDWLHNHLNVKLSFELKLRDLGEFGFLLPKHLIIPTAQEILVAIQAILDSPLFSS